MKLKESAILMDMIIKQNEDKDQDDIFWKAFAIISLEDILHEHNSIAAFQVKHQIPDKVAYDTYKLFIELLNKTPDMLPEPYFKLLSQLIRFVEIYENTKPIEIDPDSDIGKAIIDTLKDEDEQK